LATVIASFDCNASVTCGPWNRLTLARLGTNAQSLPTFKQKVQHSYQQQLPGGLDTRTLYTHAPFQRFSGRNNLPRSSSHLENPVCLNTSFRRACAIPRRNLNDRTSTTIPHKKPLKWATKRRGITSRSKWAIRRITMSRHQFSDHCSRHRLPQWPTIPSYPS